MIKNKKAIAPLVAILTILLVMLGLYIVLFIPIPAFTKIRITINYYFVVMLWFLIQFGIFYLYYKLVRYLVQGALMFKDNFLKWNMDVKHFILTKT